MNATQRHQQKRRRIQEYRRTDGKHRFYESRVCSESAFDDQEQHRPQTPWWVMPEYDEPEPADDDYEREYDDTVHDGVDYSAEAYRAQEMRYGEDAYQREQWYFDADDHAPCYAAGFRAGWDAAIRKMTHNS